MRESFVALLLIVGLAATVLPGCGKKAPEPVVRLASEVTAAGMPAAPETFQIPVEKQIIQEPAGWENDKVLEIVVPPSSEPTVLKVKKKKKTLRQALIPLKSDTNFETVSTNPGTKAMEEKRTPWWYWFLGVVGVLAVVAWIADKYFGWLSGPCAMVKKFIPFLK
jgi:hypothetical protein